MMAQLLNAGSKVGHVEYLSDSHKMSNLGNELGFGKVHNNDLHDRLEQPCRRQAKFEKRLAEKHLKEGGSVLYNSSSSYFEGVRFPLARRGYSWDHRRDLPQVSYGLLYSEEGCPRCRGGDRRGSKRYKDHPCPGAEAEGLLWPEACDGGRGAGDGEQRRNSSGTD